MAETFEEHNCILVSAIELWEEFEDRCHVIFTFFFQERYPPISKLTSALFHDSVVPNNVMKATSRTIWDKVCIEKKIEPKSQFCRQIVIDSSILHRNESLPITSNCKGDTYFIDVLEFLWDFVT